MDFSEVVTQAERHLENHDFNKGEKFLLSLKPGSSDTYNKINWNYLLEKAQIGAGNSSQATKTLLYAQKELSSQNIFQNVLLHEKWIYKVNYPNLKRMLKYLGG